MFRMFTMEIVEEKVLDEEQWKLEAQAVVNDVKDVVEEIVVALDLKNTNKYIYLNLTTLEGEKYCIELSAAGFRIVGLEYNVTSNPDSRHYETPYSLLDTVSPKYRQKFGNLLCEQLLKLQSESNE